MQNSGNIEFPNCKPYCVLQSSVVFYSHHPKSTTFRALFRNILSPKVGCWFSVGTGEVYPTTKKSTCLFSQGWPERLQFHLSPREKTLPGMGKGNILKISSMSMSGTRQTWVNPSLAEMMCNGRQWKKPLAHSRGAGWNPSPSQESLGPGTSNHVKQNTCNQVGIFYIKKHSSMWPMDANGCHLLLENNTFFGFPLSHETHQALDTSTWRSIPEWYGRLCSLPTLGGFPQVVSEGFLAQTFALCWKHLKLVLTLMLIFLGAIRLGFGSLGTSKHLSPECWLTSLPWFPPKTNIIW